MNTNMVSIHSSIKWKGAIRITKRYTQFALN